MLVQLSTAPVQPAASDSEPPVSLTLEIEGQRQQFHPGEIIPITLTFRSARPHQFVVDGATYDRSGRLTIDDFRLEPRDQATDPMRDYFALVGSLLGGGMRSIGVLGERPFEVKLVLNDWFRFDRPGTFQLSIRSRRVTDEQATPHRVVLVESNRVSFEILPRDMAWEATELDLARSQMGESQSYLDRRNGCRRLRFLGTNGAVREMIRRFGTHVESGCDFDYVAGLFGAPDRDSVLRQLEAGLRAPDQPVTASYLGALAKLAVLRSHPEFRPAPTPADGIEPSGGPSREQLDLIDEALTSYGEILDAGLPDKRGEARAITLAEYRASKRPAARADQPPINRNVVAAFPDLPPERQTRLLEYEWSTIADASLIPALRQLVIHRSTDSTSLADLALRRLDDLTPTETRPLILREIQHPRRGATLKTLGKLPDAELPEWDEVLATNFEAIPDLESQGNFDEAGIRAELVHRYASKQIANRLLPLVSEQLTHMTCRSQWATLAYFLRVEDNLGKMLLDRALASQETNGCRTSLAPIANLRMTAVVEARAIGDLDNPDPGAVMGALETLGQHGSRAAHDPLWAAFRHWHATWAGRADELEFSHAAPRPHARQAMVEDAFRQALGAAQKWVTSSAELRELQALCVTKNCRDQTGFVIDAADKPTLTILVVNGPNDASFQLAQYQLRSFVALEEKLAQYPRDTTITLRTPAHDLTSLIANIVTAASRHGIVITREP
jgi:hypothetical protein